MEILGETFPQVIIQVANNYLINPAVAGWGTVNILSLVVTVLTTCHGLWKIGYNTLDRGITLVDKPLGMSTLVDKGKEGEKHEFHTLAGGGSAAGVDEEAGDAYGDDNITMWSLRGGTVRVGGDGTEGASAASSLELVESKEKKEERADDAAALAKALEDDAAALAKALAKRDAAAREDARRLLRSSLLRRTRLSQSCVRRSKT
jgi:hypothetical protein